MNNPVNAGLADTHCNSDHKNQGGKEPDISANGKMVIPTHAVYDISGLWIRHHEQAGQADPDTDQR